MCGIGGYYTRSELDGREILEQMGRKLAHRGPDAHGTFQSAGCGLVHRRLSIIDPAESANQPLFSPDRRYVIVFNGEIYNFRQIRQQLPGPFITESDTEVVLHAFIEWGIGCVNKLNGMFAFAIFDSENNELTLVRDRIGVKPLYYCQTPDSVYFASELKALNGLAPLKDLQEVDKAAISSFLHLGYIPEPASIYTAIRKLPPASVLVIRNLGITGQVYWDARTFATYNNTSGLELSRARLKELIENAVTRNLISDVPFGVFLSGGVDSSLVAAIAAGAGSSPLKTFTIGFDDSGKDESLHAAKVANFLQTDHHAFKLHWSEAKELLEEGMDLFDEPFGDSSFLPVMMISRIAAQQVKMVLTGEGGDELFYGYGAHRWAHRLSHPAKRSLVAATTPFLPLLGSRGNRVKSLLQYSGTVHHRAHIFSQEQYFFALHELKSLLKTEPDSQYIPEDNCFDFCHSATPADKQAFFDLRVYLPGDLLTKVDRASMHYGLECRVPLLDHDVVEFALSLPFSMKFRKNTWKFLLKQVLTDYLPEEFFQRPKQGLDIPLATWLRYDLKPVVDTYLSDTAIMQTAVLQVDFVKKLLKDFYIGNQHYLYNRIWLLIVLQRWLFKHLK